MAVPEAQGGWDASVLDLALVAEQVGRAAAPQDEHSAPCSSHLARLVEETERWAAEPDEDGAVPLDEDQLRRRLARAATDLEVAQLLELRTTWMEAAFGFGPHYCLGASLARLELRVMLREVLARLPDLALDNTEPLPYRPSNFVSGLEAMPVRFSPTPVLA